MRFSFVHIAAIIALAAFQAQANSLGIEPDESEWHNYTWPRNQSPERLYAPDHGASERYLEAIRDVEQSIERLPAAPEARFPQTGGQAAYGGAPIPTAPAPYPQQFMANQYPNPTGMAYPPYYSAQPAPPAYPDIPTAPAQAPYNAAPAAPQPYGNYYAPPQAYNPQGLSAERMRSQEQFSRQKSDFWNLSFGVGLGYIPKFQGADENDLRPLPIIDVSYRDKFFVNTSLGAGINLYNENGMRAGPFTTIDFGRDSDDAVYLAGADDVDPALESGIFFEKNFDPFSFLWTARYAVLNRGHGGLISDAELSYRVTIQPGLYGTVGGSISWASQDYMISYFGVSPNHSAVSGLRQYTPEAGFKDIGLFGSLLYVLDERISVMANAGVKQLHGEAEGSPIVEQGDELQMFGGTGVIYNF